jgi:heat-inducible transcriptional repressor
VDHLVEFGMADMQAAENAKGALHQERAETLERILKQTCALLTQLTHYTSVATRPRPADTRLRQVIAAPVGDSAILFVALLSSGDSETRLLSGKAALLALEDPLSLTHAVNAFNMQWAAKTIDSIRISLEAQLDVPADLVGGGKRVIYLEFVEAFKQIVASASANGAIMEGAREMFRQPEFHDVEKLDPVFATLQMHPRFVDDIVATPVSGDVAVVIGTENQVEPLHECSVVAAPYLVGTRERGSLGVIGPTRMAYDKVIPTVSYMAKSLTEMLSLIA